MKPQNFLIKKELIHSIINKTMFSILLEQERVLSEINFPHFNRNIIEKIEDFIRRKKNAITGGSNIEVLFDPNLIQEIMLQSGLICGLLSLRLNALNSIHISRQNRFKMQRNEMYGSGQHLNMQNPEFYNDIRKKSRRRKFDNPQTQFDSYSGSTINSYRSDQKRKF